MKRVRKFWALSRPMPDVIRNGSRGFDRAAGRALAVDAVLCSGPTAKPRAQPDTLCRAVSFGPRLPAVRLRDAVRRRQLPIWAVVGQSRRHATLALSAISWAVPRYRRVDPRAAILTLD